MRVVYDANVFVSAAISSGGAPARLVEHWLNGDVEVVVCPALVDELRRALARPKVARRIAAEDATQLLESVTQLAEVVTDPRCPPPVRTRDRGDDYLIALAAEQDVVLVTGDADLLELAPHAPVLMPRQFLERLEPGSRS